MYAKLNMAACTHFQNVVCFTTHCMNAYIYLTKQIIGVIGKGKTQNDNIFRMCNNVNVPLFLNILTCISTYATNISSDMTLHTLFNALSTLYFSQQNCTYPFRTLF